MLVLVSINTVNYSNSGLAWINQTAEAMKEPLNQFSSWLVYGKCSVNYTK